MKNTSKLMTCGLALSLTLSFLSLTLPADAQRSRSRSGTGTYQRSGHQGRTRTGTTQSTVQTERGKGYRQRNAEGSLSSPKGERTYQGESRTERTGPNGYDRQWERSTTNASGETKTSSGQGSGTVNKTDTGYSRTYDGTVTAPNGSEYNVNKTSDTVKTDSGFETDRTKTVTDSQGNVVGTGQSTTTGVKGEGPSTTGTWMGPNGGTSTYQGQSNKTETGVVHTQTVINPSGQSRTNSSEFQWEPTEGEED